MKCKDCKHWKNEQAELDYAKLHGICTCYKWKFTTTNDSGIMLLDRKNPSEKHMGVQRFETQSHVVPHGRPEKSRYCFVTDEEFGCIHYEKRKK